MSKRNVAAAAVLLAVPAAIALSFSAFWRPKPAPDPADGMSPEDYQSLLEVIGTYFALRNRRAAVQNGEVIVEGPEGRTRHSLRELVEECRGLSRAQWPAAVGRFFAPEAASGAAWPKLETERPAATRPAAPERTEMLWPLVPPKPAAPAQHAEPARPPVLPPMAPSLSRATDHAGRDPEPPAPTVSARDAVLGWPAATGFPVASPPERPLPARDAVLGRPVEPAASPEPQSRVAYHAPRDPASEWPAFCAMVESYCHRRGFDVVVDLTGVTVRDAAGRTQRLDVPGLSDMVHEMQREHWARFIDVCFGGPLREWRDSAAPAVPPRQPPRVTYHTARESDARAAGEDLASGEDLAAATAAVAGAALPEEALPEAEPPRPTISAIEAVLGHPPDLLEPPEEPSGIAERVSRLLAPLSRVKDLASRGKAPQTADPASPGQVPPVAPAPAPSDPLAGYSLADACELLALQLFAEDALSPEEREASVYSDDLPGLLSAVVCRLPEGAVRVSPRMLDQWDVEAEDIFIGALANLRRLRPAGQPVTFAPGLEGMRYESADGFAAAQALLLGEDASARGPFGALVALPRPGLLLVCPLRPVPDADAAVGDAVTALVQQAVESERQGHAPLARSLYWYHDGAFSGLRYEVRMEGGELAIELYPPDEFVAALEEMARSVAR